MATFKTFIKMHKSLLNGALIPTVEEEYFNKINFPLDHVYLDNGKESYFLQIAQHFYKNKFRILQVITENPSVIEKIKEYCQDAKIIAGGHISSIKEAENFLNCQSDYIIIERLFAQKPSLVKSYFKLFGRHLIVSIGDKDGFLAGNKDIRTEEFAHLLGKLKVRNVLYVFHETNLSGGLNLEAFKKIRNIIGSSNVGYSGGISSLDDIEKLRNLGANFVVVGTALYTGSLNYRDATKLFKNEN